MTNPEDALIVNTLVRQALISAEEVMDTNGLHAVLRSCGLQRYFDQVPPDDLDPGIKAKERICTF